MRVLARMLVVVFLLLPLCTHSQEEPAQAPEGYADRICDTPQNLTGAVQVGPGPTAHNHKPSMVWDGSAYGVVWTDTAPGNYEIYFARVATDGTLLVPATRITNDAGQSLTPSLAWTGTEYGVAWYDSRTTASDVYFARISTAGVKIGGDVQITSNPGMIVAPSLVWTGTEYGVAWQDTRTTGWDIYFARISAGGSKIGSDVQITSDPYNSFAPSLVWTGTEYGVAWGDSRTTTFDYDIYFTKISAAGVKIGSDLQVTNTTGSSENPSLVWAGGNYGVTWQDSRTTGYDLYFARLNMAGAKIGSDVQLTSNTNFDVYPTLVWTGSEYGAVYQSGVTVAGEIGFLRVSSTGVKQGSEVAVTSDGFSTTMAGLAFGTKGYGATYNWATTTLKFLGLGCHNDATPPSCPASPAEASRTSTSVTLGWGPSQDPENDVAHYDVYKDGTFAGVTTATTWTDSSFNPVAGPVYVISATNAAGLTSPACSSVDTSDLVPPTCPENLLASSVTQTSATLDWLPSQDAKSGLKQYRVYRNDVQLNTVAAGTTTYTDGTLSANSPYNFAVRSEDWAGNFSTTCTTASVYISTAPIVLMMQKNADRTNANLNWNNVNLNEYVVYRSQNPQTASELKRVPVTSTTDPVLNDGVHLWFYYIQQRE